MLHVLFSLADDRYAIRATDIVELLPLAELKRIPPAPAYIAGLLNFRGEPVPVLDLGRLIHDAPCERRLSTRILVINYALADDDHRQLGLMAENVTEVFSRTAEQALSPGLEIGEASYLESVYVDASELIQLLNVRELLPTEVRQSLFSASDAREISLQTA
jgi:chemotaxis-related protein WspB